MTDVQPTRQDDSVGPDAGPLAFGRRGALCGLAGLGVLGVALAACGSDDKSGGGNGKNSPSGSTSDEAGVPLTPTSEVPVGGGIKVVAPDGTPLIVTQPTQGVFKAYDARCTHMQTPVDPPKNGIMTCPNHGSRFRVADGSVARDPATRPLKQVGVAVSGSNVVTT